jgi:hypothetical protein
MPSKYHEKREFALTCPIQRPAVQKFTFNANCMIRAGAVLLI